MNHPFKTLLSIILGIIGILGAGYILIYLGLYCPITTLIDHSNSNTLSGDIVFWQVLMFLGRGLMTTLWVGFIGILLMLVNN